MLFYSQVVSASFDTKDVSKISVKKSNQPIWFNSNVHHKIKCLRTAKKQHARHPTESKRLKVIDLQRELQQMISDAKHDYESNLALNYAHNNNNKIFKYMSIIKGCETFLLYKMYFTNDSASTDKGMAQLFNNYFYSVFSPTTSSSSSVSEPQIRRDNPYVQDIVFSNSDVLTLLASLDVRKR